MTLEEAVQWCINREVEVLFYRNHEKPTIVIYDLGDTWKERVSLGEGVTLIEAVEKASHDLQP